MGQAKFAAYCKMTCLGGSERGECPCKHPNACELQDHPEYAGARKEAKHRMLRYLANSDVHPTIKEAIDEKIKGS